MIEQKAWLEEQISQSFKIKVSLAISCTQLELSQLTKSELARFALISHPKRQTSWLTGRQVLKQLSNQNDTSQIKFPHPQLSLTHSGNYALCIKSIAEQGIGLDFQVVKKVKKGIEKFFLTNTEQTWLNSLTEKNYNLNLLKSWTIKEAAFKADLQQTSLKDYQIINPMGKTGSVFKTSTGCKFQFIYFQLADGLLSVCQPQT